MANRKQSQKLFFVISLCVALVTMLFLGAVNAQTVTFTYKLTCNTGAPGCPNSNLRVATQVGHVASDSVAIATVKSDVPGYTQPVPISGGSLSWMSTPATIRQTTNAVSRRAGHAHVGQIGQD
jgi:hypothetical protein